MNEPRTLSSKLVSKPLQRVNRIWRVLADFIKSARRWSLSSLCEEVGASIIEGRPDQQIDTVSSIAAPVKGGLVLLMHKKYIAKLPPISGLVCLTSAEIGRPYQRASRRPYHFGGRTTTCRLCAHRPDDVSRKSANAQH